MTNNYTVYMHIFPNGKKYIGITCQNPQKRWQNGYGYVEQDLMWKAIQKYGWNNIEHKIIYSNISKREAELMEIYLIKEHKTNVRQNGYNIANGGNALGTMSEETKEKIREAHIGKPRSEETKEKLRKANLGKKLKEETKSKISKKLKEKNSGEKNPFYGKKHSEETKEKLSQNMKGSKNPNWGKHCTEEMKFKCMLVNAKPIICVETNKKYFSAKDAQRKTNISATSIGKCLRNKQKTAGGYHWKYISEVAECQEK